MEAVHLPKFELTMLPYMAFKFLPQSSFLRLMEEMYQQESDDMIQFIEESRRQLKLVGHDIAAEQDALQKTSHKICKLNM